MIEVFVSTIRVLAVVAGFESWRRRGVRSFRAQSRSQKGRAEIKASLAGRGALTPKGHFRKIVVPRQDVSKLVGSDMGRPDFVESHSVTEASSTPSSFPQDASSLISSVQVHKVATSLEARTLLAPTSPAACILHSPSSP